MHGTGREHGKNRGAGLGGVIQTSKQCLTGSENSYNHMIQCHWYDWLSPTCMLTLRNPIHSATSANLMFDSSGQCIQSVHNLDLDVDFLWLQLAFL